MNHRPFDLVAIDLDDTLLNPNHEISNGNRRAVAQVRAAGAEVIIASGRMHGTTLRYAAELGLTGPIVSYNGAMVRPPGSEPWLHLRITPDAAASVMNACESQKLQLNYYLDDVLYAPFRNRWIELYRERTGAEVVYADDYYTRLRGTSPTKLLIVDSPEATTALLAPFQKQFGERLFITRSNEEYLEFMPPEANKGTALALAASRLGIEQSRTLAFGDSWNDVAMLQWAGRSIAVGNAKPEAKSAADEVTLPSWDDGVAAALTRIFDL